MNVTRRPVYNTERVRRVQPQPLEVILECCPRLDLVRWGVFEETEDRRMYVITSHSSTQGWVQAYECIVCGKTVPVARVRECYSDLLERTSHNQCGAHDVWPLIDTRTDRVYVVCVEGAAGDDFFEPDVVDMCGRDYIGDWVSIPIDVADDSSTEDDTMMDADVSMADVSMAGTPRDTDEVDGQRQQELVDLRDVLLNICSRGGVH